MFIISIYHFSSSSWFNIHMSWVVVFVNKRRGGDIWHLTEWNVVCGWEDFIKTAHLGKQNTWGDTKVNPPSVDIRGECVATTTTPEEKSLLSFPRWNAVVYHLALYITWYRGTCGGGKLFGQNVYKNTSGFGGKRAARGNLLWSDEE